MEDIKKNLEYLTGHHEEIYNAYQNFGKLLHERGGPLEEKVRSLIKIAISASEGYEYDLHKHIHKAVESNATLEEIEHAILLVASTAGFPKMMKALVTFRHIVEDENLEK
jgi:alkylhydroperoxidase/carboxymuconolactone decarboxylase family protein YurZ